jgi:hypothetical protein
MDPKILQQLLQRQGGQQGADPSMNAQSAPQNSGTQDPLASLSAQHSGNPFQSMMDSMNTPQGGPQASPGAPQGPQSPDPMNPKANQLTPGANPGMSKYLSTAIAQLQSFIAESTNRDEIMTARGVISLLSQLVQDEQTRKADELQVTPQPQQAPQGQVPAGQ